jgi:hypothetical protein
MLRAARQVKPGNGAQKYFTAAAISAFDHPS